jgi:hypothetical protein
VRHSFIPEEVLISCANVARFSLSYVRPIFLWCYKPVRHSGQKCKSPSVGAERLEMILVEELSATPFSILSIQRYISVGLFQSFYPKKYEEEIFIYGSD